MSDKYDGLPPAMAEILKQDDVIKDLRHKLQQAEARVAELERERDNEHQRERRNAARDYVQKMKVDSLRKQAEAVEGIYEGSAGFETDEEGEGFIWARDIKDYAQRLRQQADELEKQNGS